MAAPTRCALFANHAGDCATWPSIRDDQLPKTGTRCPLQVEPRVEFWQTAITRHQLLDDDLRHWHVRRARHHAARFGYRGRIRFVRIEGWHDVDMYAIRVLPARPGERATA
jgi:hypothetical protein